MNNKVQIRIQFLKLCKYALTYVIQCCPSNTKLGWKDVFGDSRKLRALACPIFFFVLLKDVLLFLLILDCKKALLLFSIQPLHELHLNLPDIMCYKYNQVTGT